MSRAAAHATIDVPPLSLLARANVATANQDDRSVELVFSTGAPVERYDWMADTKYLEQLEISKAAIRIGRLNTAPLLNAHSAWSIEDQIGTVVAGSFRIEGGDAIVRVRFSSRESVAGIWQDVMDRIVQNVSVGYRVHKFEENQTGAIPVRTAVDWEPYEVSMVPMPADVGARVRNHDVSTNSCLIIRKEKPVRNDPAASPETIAEDPAAAGLRLHPADPTPTEPTDVDRAIAAETARVEGLILAARAGRMPQTFVDTHIKARTPLLEVQRLVFVELMARGNQSAGPQPGPSSIGVGDPFVHERAGIEEALLNRIVPKAFPLTDKGKAYRGLSVLDCAKLCLHGRNIRTTDLSKRELAGLALGLDIRGGMHTTSDFPYILDNVLKKSLQARYQEAPQTYEPITKRTTTSDFKLISRVQLGDAPALLEVREHGEFTRGTISEAREQYRVKTYGRVFAITRQALIDDDLGAFGEISTMFGQAARNLESDLLWDQIVSNPDMGDGDALFSAAHLNYDASGDILSVESLGIARAAIRAQVSLDGNKINIAPRYLIVPIELETQADKIVAPITANTAGAVNPFSGKLIVIAEPRLTDPLAWYLSADPQTGQVQVLELAMLEGESGPTVETRVGFDVDGIEVKCRHDIGAKVMDWKGLYKNAGDENT